MKRILPLLLTAGVGGMVVMQLFSTGLQRKYAAQLALREAAWRQERAELEEARRLALAQRATSPALPAASLPLEAPASRSPAEIVARLRALKSATNAPASPTRLARSVIHDLEELLEAGPSALPALRDFLRRNEDVDFDFVPAGPGKGPRGTLPSEFLLPPSLRFGLFEVLRHHASAPADELLAEMLSSTGRGVELAWLARVLQERTPNRYRETALTAARELLARPLNNTGSALDRNDRDYLYSVLVMYGDTSYAHAAQEQLVQADGRVDRSALKYLQDALGPQAVPVAARSFDDPRITDPANKEPFARLALSYVGADAQANEFYQHAINDMTLSRSHRKNLIEDLNQDGFADLKNLGARDLPLIENRISLIEQLAPHATDPSNVAAFKEAYKDLINMRARVQSVSKP
jgi:hypothetical protein